MINIIVGLLSILSCFGLAAFILYFTKHRKESYDQSIVKTKIQPGKKIPKHIYMTYKDKQNIPSNVLENYSRHAKYNGEQIPYTIYDDDDCLKFITKYFNKKVADCFVRLSRGAYRADLFRYCILYIKGGIYFDIKTKLIKPLDKIFNLDQNVLYTVLPEHPTAIYQGILLSPRGNKIFLDLIYAITQLSDYEIDHDYQVITTLTKNILTKYSISGKLLEGHGRLSNNMGCYLFTEKCTTDIPLGIHADKYGLYCKIYDKDNHVIDSRYHDFGSTW